MPLPIVDLEGLRPAGRASVAAALDRALGEVGFCYLAHTGVAPRTVEAMFEASRRFHALPAEAKQALAINAHHRGYMAPSTSVLRSSRVAEVRRPNLSESFLIMHEVSEGDPEFGQPLHGPNQWPDLPGFRASAQRYQAALGRLARGLTGLLCEALGLAADHLDAHFLRPVTWLRLLHYPPLPEGAPADQYGAAPHTDYGFITLLAQDRLGGLEVRAPDGGWIPAPPVPGTFVLNVGDMLERWTDGRWPSTPHRVRNRSGRDRYSVPFFYDPSLDTTVDTLPGLPRRTARPPIRYREYLLERLDRNYDYRRKLRTEA